MIRALPLLVLFALACTPDSRAPDTSDVDGGSCGLLGHACCENNSCASGLSCESSVCQQGRMGDLGKPCTRNADCSSNTCLPIGNGQNACTLPCTGESSCTKGWSCAPLSGVAGSVCQCSKSAEVCDALDNDCDGIVDNEPLVDQQCAATAGLGFTCIQGRCGGMECTTAADCLAGQTCNPTTHACETASLDGGGIDAGIDGGGTEDAGPVDGGFDGGSHDGGSIDGGTSDGGSDVVGGCHLTGDATLAFGSVAVGVQARRDYAITNDGTGSCTFPQSASITQGGSSRFAVTASPSTPLAPGATTVVSVTYTPQDLVADTGQLSVPHGNTAQGTSTLTVALQGTPISTGECRLSVTPSSTLAFGQVRVQTESILPITFTNTGSGPCSLLNARLMAGFQMTTDGFRIAEPPVDTLAPGAMTAVRVGFLPTAPISYGGGTFPLGGTSVWVDTSDTFTFNGSSCSSFPSTGPAGCVGITLSGTGVGPQLIATPERLDFGTVTTSCNSFDQTITLNNVSTSELSITELALDPASAATNFSISGQTLPLVLASGAARTLTVHFHATTSATVTAHLNVKYSIGTVAGEPVSIALSGAGSTSSHQTDVFSQSTQPQADVLFIVDDSGSMAEEQSLLASNASSFLAVADQHQADYHVAVTTTDMEAATKTGNFQGSPRIITPGTSAATQFANTVRGLGTNGSGTEQGLAAMYAALSPPLITDSSHNGGFLRPDARLAVIIVSDEDDQSSGSTDFYRDFLKQVKGRFGYPYVSFSAIVGPSTGTNSSGDVGCTSSNGDAVAGYRYLAVQQQTGGSFLSICSQSWSGLATQLAPTLFSARDTFTLSRVPNGSLTVRVNNSTVNASSYTFDSAANAVIFAAGSVPAAGASITVDYSAQCL